MNLKQIKFSLAVVINLLAALTFGYFCFLGANFYSLGDRGTSIAVAVIISLLLIGTSLGAKLLKQTKGNFKNRLIWETILLVLFTLLIVWLTYFRFSHYFVVKAKENIIKEKLFKNISQSKTVYDDYIKYIDTLKKIHKNNLETAVTLHKAGIGNADFLKLGLRDEQICKVTYQTQINNGIANLHNTLMPAAIKSIKNQNSIWLANATDIVTNFEPIGIFEVINNIQSRNENNIIRLVKQSSNNRIKTLGYKAFKLSKNPDFGNVKPEFITHGTPPPIAILCAISAYFLMLLSWFITKRDNKPYGRLAKYEIEL